MKLVVDNNVLVSRLLLPDSVPGRAVRRVVLHEQILVSEATMSELADALSRPKFDRYVSLEGRRSFLAHLTEIAVWISITHRIRACLDPRDDKFLELAASGRADLIVSGDADLLVLNPFRGIPIVSAATFVQGATHL